MRIGDEELLADIAAVYRGSFRRRHDSRTQEKDRITDQPEFTGVRQTP
jgi:hypothetical protein